MRYLIHNNALPVRRAVLLRLLIGFILSGVLTACAHQSGGSLPLPEGFAAKVTTLMTTSVRIHISGDQGMQDRLREQIPEYERMESMAALMEALHGDARLSVLVSPLEADLSFELDKPENSEIRDRANTPEIRREIVTAVVQGMKRALEQLRGGGNGS